MEYNAGFKTYGFAVNEINRIKALQDELRMKGFTQKEIGQQIRAMGELDAFYGSPEKYKYMKNRISTIVKRPRTRGGRDRRQTKAADENGNRRDGNRTAPHLTRRALLTPTPPMGAHSALASALPPLRPHAPCMCASARAPVLVRNGERTRATWGLRG